MLNERDNRDIVRNATTKEYDDYARWHGVEAAKLAFPVSLTYRFSLTGSEDWTLYFTSDAERAKFARTVRGIGGRVTGASGGDVTGVYVHGGRA